MPQAKLHVGREGTEGLRNGRTNRIAPSTRVRAFLLILLIFPSAISHSSLLAFSVLQDKEQPTAIPLAKVSERRWCSTIFLLLFSVQLLVTFILSIYLTVRGLLAAFHTHKFHPSHWYPPLLTSSLSGIVFSFAWLAAVLHRPETTIKAAFWLAPLLTFAAGILAIAIGTAGSLTVAAFSIVLALSQSLYACWVRRRHVYAVRILSTSLLLAARVSSDLTKHVALALLAAFIYSCFWVSAVGGIVSWGSSFLAVIFLLALLASIIWTMHMIKNVIHASVARVGYLHGGVDLEAGLLFQRMGSGQIGSICLGSALVPLICLLRGLARAMSLFAGDVDEFMFSCVSCYSGITERLISCGNRWGLVYVGMFGKPFIQASADVWGAFARNGMEQLIETDLTVSVCFLCGVASGAACSILGGAWTFAVEKSYATRVLIYGFLIGYFMSRISMAWPQACVSAYYVVYVEFPQSQLFDSTIPDRIRQLQRS